MNNVVNWTPHMRNILELLQPRGKEANSSENNIIDLNLYGLRYTIVPFDSFESRVFVSRRSPDGRKRIIKIYDTPFSRDVIDIDLLKKYQNLTNLAASMPILELPVLRADGETITCVVQVVPVEKVGVVVGLQGNFPVSISPYIHGTTLNKVGGYSLFEEYDACYITLKAIGSALNEQLRVSCIEIDPLNVKPMVIKNTLILRITDICACVSSVAGRKPNYDFLRQQR